MKLPFSVRLQQDMIAALDSLRELLPLAERYLSGAPSDPDNAKLETARAILHEYGLSTSESAQSSPGSLRRAHQLTVAERNAVLEAIGFRLSGEYDGDANALRSAMEKL